MKNETSPQDRAAQNARVVESFPKRLLTTSYVVTFLVLVWMGLSSYTANQRVDTDIVKNFKMSGYVDQMTYIGTDSVQTIKLLTAQTDPNSADARKLEEAHSKNTLQLDAVFQKARSRAFDAEMVKQIDAIKTASDHLVGLENTAVTLFHQGKMEEAQNVVVSKDYAQFRKIYSQQCRALSESIDHYSERDLADFSHAIRLSFYIILVTLFAMPSLWFYSYRAVRQWQSHLEETQNALLHSEERYDLALRGMSVGVWDWDAATGILYWSPRFREMIGEAAEAYKGTFAEFAERIHPEEKESVHEAMTAHLEKKEPYDTEFRFKKNDGTYIWIRACGQATWDTGGKPMRVVGSVDDISERKGAEESRVNLVKQLTESNTELERFAYVASHDMQEPLRMVANFSKLVSTEYRDKLDKDGQEYLDIISGSALRMQNMVNDLLAYARLSKEARDEVTFDATVELAHVLDNLTSAIKERKAVIDYHDQLPTIKGNPVQFMRLMQNLIANGLKYQKKGTTPRIDIQAADKRGCWEFAIKDNGIGMEAKNASIIFEPFKRLHSWAEYQGSGLGLSSCKKIVESHGGKIWVNSKPGDGSTFYFTWPKT